MRIFTGKSALIVLFSSLFLLAHWHTGRQLQELRAELKTLMNSTEASPAAHWVVSEGANTDLEQLRQIIREAVASRDKTSVVPSAGTGTSEAVAASDNHEPRALTRQQENALAETQNYLQSVLSSGELTLEESIRLQRSGQELPDSEKLRITDQILTAINNQQLRLSEGVMMPF